MDFDSNRLKQIIRITKSLPMLVIPYGILHLLTMHGFVTLRPQSKEMVLSSNSRLNPNID